MGYTSCTRSQTNWAVQPSSARGYRLEISEILKVEDVAKTKALIICTVITQLICALFSYMHAKIRFSHDVTHLCSCIMYERMI